MGYIYVRDWIPIMIICSVGAQGITSQSNEQIQILQPPPSLIFQQVGALYPTLNFAHIRVSANLSELQTNVHRVCSTAELFKGLSNYTTPGILRNLNPQATTDFSSAEKGKYPTKPFTSVTRAMVSSIESKCHEGEVSMGLVQQIFRSVPIASSTGDTVHDRSKK